MISVPCRKYKFDLNERRNVKELKAFYFILLSLADESSKMTIAEKKNKIKKHVTSIPFHDNKPKDPALM